MTKGAFNSSDADQESTSKEPLKRTSVATTRRVDPMRAANEHGPPTRALCRTSLSDRRPIARTVQTVFDLAVAQKTGSKMACPPPVEF